MIASNRCSSIERIAIFFLQIWTLLKANFIDKILVPGKQEKSLISFVHIVQFKGTGTWYNQICTFDSIQDSKNAMFANRTHAISTLVGQYPLAFFARICLNISCFLIPRGSPFVSITRRWRSSTSVRSAISSLRSSDNLLKALANFCFTSNWAFRNSMALRSFSLNSSVGSLNHMGCSSAALAEWGKKTCKRIEFVTLSRILRRDIVASLSIGAARCLTDSICQPSDDEKNEQTARNDRCILRRTLLAHCILFDTLLWRLTADDLSDQIFSAWMICASVRGCES